MQVILEKRLTSSEKERHWVIVPSVSRKHFPTPDVIFTITVFNKRSQTYIDRYNRLRLGARIFDKLGLDEPGSSIVIGKNPDGIYVLRKSKKR
mgnify:CR=1 FL=1